MQAPSGHARPVSRGGGYEGFLMHLASHRCGTVHCETALQLQSCETVAQQLSSALSMPSSVQSGVGGLSGSLAGWATLQVDSTHRGALNKVEMEAACVELHVCMPYVAREPTQAKLQTYGIEVGLGNGCV